jgi:broad specificity phosphatase PhoE
MTRVILIHAGPTPWEEENRVVGDQSLPLTDAARVAIGSIVDQLPADVEAIYRAKKNEACDEVAKMVAARFKIPARNNDDLHGLNLGLWQGLTFDTIRSRFRSVFTRWEKNPLAVRPPEGETIEQASARVQKALRAILRRNRESTIVIPLRPLIIRIAAGLLRTESIEQTAADLRNVPSIETIELAENPSKHWK